ncbi:MAG: hypothetical protein ACHBN1_00630 [Heteroscytonema crispum UTEX LB 1556]
MEIIKRNIAIAKKQLETAFLLQPSAISHQPSFSLLSAFFQPSAFCLLKFPYFSRVFRF